MTQVVTAGDAASPSTFAKNVMEIAVPPTNPADVTGVADLGKSSVTTALCQPQVPCGTTAAQVFTNAKVTVKPVTLEPDVKSVLSKVELGEVDAGMVYVTDVIGAGSKVKGVQIPADVNASTSYPIAAISKSGNSAAAQAFVAYVLSPAGQAVLSAAGFEAP
jgi:molybdate transport system substrate-binding protein